MTELSIIIPAYRAEATIGRTMASIRAQQPADAEIIVIVDGEGDRTAEVAGSFEGVRVILNGARCGVCASRNRGLQLASGRFVTFPDADDYIEGHLHSGMVAALKESGADFVFGSHVQELQRPTRRGLLSLSGAFAESSGDRDQAIVACLRYGVLNGATAWRAESLRSIGGWNAHVRRANDMELVMRALVQGLRLGLTDVGRYVQVCHRGAHRISNESVASNLESYRAYLTVVEDYAREAGESRRLLQRALAVRYYRLAAHCFGENAVAEGEALLADARRLGLEGHPGTPLHRVVATMVGLQRKTKVAAIARRLKVRVGQ